MMEELQQLVILSRLQFSFVALFHFLFVPLTLGLTFLIAIMETVYVMTGKVIYRDMTKFWGKLFGINFALGIASGLTMEFSFGTNWSYYSHFVGDVFGVPLAIEGLMAFFLEATMVGIFFFGWDKLSKVQHMMVTWFMALGTNFSALWILIANAWMQYPIGAELNLETMRMEMSSFTEVLFNPVAQVKFVHTAAAGYTTASMFVLAISAWYLLKGRDIGFAKRSFAIAAAFGTASIFSVILLGDESGYTSGELQKYKLAAIEAEYETEPAPAAIKLLGIPDDENMVMRYSIEIPYVLGIMATRSLDGQIEGIRDIVKRNEGRVRNGMEAYALMTKIRDKSATEKDKKAFAAVQKDIGYGLLLKAYTANVIDATDAQIKMAARDTVPAVAPLFYAFRIMVAAGLFMLCVFVAAFYWTAKRTVFKKRWFLRVVLYSLPLPWIAAEAGWIVAEYGRQPWAVGEILPTFVAVSHLSVTDLYVSLSVFVLVYAALVAIEMYLMIKFARIGPSAIHTGKYYYETGAHTSDAPSDKPDSSAL